MSSFVPTSLDWTDEGGVGVGKGLTVRVDGGVRGREAVFRVLRVVEDLREREKRRVISEF